MWYLRGESKFSDHRPVHSLFSAQIDVGRKSAKYVKSKVQVGMSRVKAEEQLLLHQSCPHLNRRRGSEPSNHSVKVAATLPLGSACEDDEWKSRKRSDCVVYL